MESKSRNIAYLMDNSDIAPLSVVNEISEALIGIPTYDRVLLLTNSGEKQTQGGIIIPGLAKEDLPRRGVVIKTGLSSDEDTHKLIGEKLQTGMVVTYGLYAGKEVNPMFYNQYELPSGYSLVVLSFNEIIFLELHPELVSPK